MSCAAFHADGPAVRVRLARYLACCGVGSRRRCEELIRGGVVELNGVRVDDPAVSVDPVADRVACGGRAVRPAAPLWLLLNKPPGYTCSARDAHAQRLVYELLPPDCGRLFSVGRLDRDSEGLLLLTNDGALAQQLTHPSMGVEKRYEVHVRGVCGPDVLRRLRRGVVDQGETLRPLGVTVLRRFEGGAVLCFALVEGRKREIRRLCAAVGLAVVRLRRTVFGPLRLGPLPSGRWRALGEAEVEALRGCVGSGGGRGSGCVGAYGGHIISDRRANEAWP
ncbi:MAG: rRNA pseudouridine synthase [Lentisphaeria bacterium]|nr:rRNA pseudouridine synthase [Lentisphaeria bacterium]